MDGVSLAIANCVACNDRLAAAVEIGPLGAVFTAKDGPVRIALAGAKRRIEIGTTGVPMCETALMAEGETLTLGPSRDGVFSYLAMEGGIAGNAVFGSLSVNERSGLGAPYPRSLQVGDELVTGTAQPNAHERGIDIPHWDRSPFRVVLGPQDDEFGTACDLFLESEWRVSAISDRMGYRLEGPQIAHDRGHNIVSDGTVNGSIQVPGSGQPIVLMMDRGTTGGYPKIATLITADLGRFAQMQAGASFGFVAVSIETAQAEARKLEVFLRSLSGRVRAAGATNLNIAELQNANVAGAAVNAIDTVTWQTRPIGEP